LYEKTINEKKLYTRSLIRILFPVIIVLYNGKEELPDCIILKLSDMFTDPSSLGISADNPALELTVKVININHGRNAEIARKSKTLAGYSAFVAKVREFEDQGLERAEAIKQAVKYCRDHDILKEFMEKNSSEVFNMLLSEWNMDDALAVRFEEGWEGGREEGREEGVEVGLERGREEREKELALNALAKGLPLELIHDLTGLDLETIARLQANA